ncbi:hypothetical protein GF402_01560 [Candidatus Fermentibacteria bacterium]|nr:hypothetical protein [Candidatus Fermentibacteria bacterium]
MTRAVLILLFTVFTVQGASIVNTFDAPAGSIGGLGWENGVLWALDTESTTAFSIDPANGDLLSSLDIEYIPGYEPYGMAVNNDTLFICQLKYGGPDSYYCYHSAHTGAYLGMLDLC